MKAVFIRLLQVLWVLGVVLTVVATIAVFITGEELGALAAVAFVLFFTLVITQYLVFGKLNPMSAFNGSLIKSRYPR